MSERKECFLAEIDHLINWNPLEKLLRKTLKRVVTRDDFVLCGHATPANRSDTEEFVADLDEVDAKAGESIFADKGYSSQLYRYVLQVRGLADGIMHKAARNRARLPQKKSPTVKSAASA